MLRKLSAALLAVSVIAFFAPKANAQFEYQKNYGGAHIGLSGVGSALTLGLDYERGITQVGEVGPGIIGLGGVFDYYSYTYVPSVTLTYMDLGVSGMYHLVLKDSKWDPFAGLILGYEVASWSAYAGYLEPSVGGFTLAGSAGVRYFFNDHWAAQARIGFGFYVLAVGVDYKF